MNQRPGGDPTGGAGATAHRIERAAAQLFMERGFSATSIRDIAAAVGIKPPSLYAHFASKEEILRAILVGAFRRHLVDLNRRLSSPPGVTPLTATEQLDALTAATASSATDSQEATYVGLHDVTHLSVEQAAAVTRLHLEFVRIVTEIVSLGRRSGEFTATEDTEVLVLAIRALGSQLARLLVESPRDAYGGVITDFQAFARRVVGAAPLEQREERVLDR